MALPPDEWSMIARKLAIYRSPLDVSGMKRITVQPIWHEMGYTMCQHCSSLSCLDLRKVLPKHESPNAHYSGAGEMAQPTTQDSNELESGPNHSKENVPTYWGAWQGPTIRHIMDHRDSCRLCWASYQVLSGTDSLQNNESCRTILRLQPSEADGSGTFQFQPSHFTETEPESQYYSPAVWLSIDVEVEPASCKIPIIPRHALRVYAPKGISEQARDSCPGQEPSQCWQQDAPNMIKKWLKDCRYRESMELCRAPSTATVLANHVGCLDLIGESRTLQQNPKLPTRLIAVSANESLVKAQLVEPYNDLDESERHLIKYVALSYCWGHEPVVRLTVESLNHFKTALPMYKLPETIVDAIEMCQACGYHYIWVDSLCILQDDDLDWEREARAMADVYQNADITFAILGQRSSHTGISNSFHVDNLLHIPWFDCDSSGWTQNGYVVVNIALPLERSPQGVVYTALQQEKRESLWSTRAWTYQEDVLSRRVVYFGNHQIYWDCRAISCSEDCLDELIRRQDGLYSYRASFYVSMIELGGFFSSDEEAKALKMIKKLRLMPAPGLMRNDEFLKQYSPRHLTNSADKLLAFDGLAQLVARRTNQEFHAGVWSIQTAKSLWWHSAGGHISRPKPFRAPSWSFASVDGALHGDRPRHSWELDFDKDGDVKLDIDLGSLRSNGLASLINVRYEPRNPLMSNARGVKRLSMQVTALSLDVSPSHSLCSEYPQTMKQLQEDIQIWLDGYYPWPPERCHLLFARDPAPKVKATPHVCQTCRTSITSMSERMAIEHYETCRLHTQAPPTSQEAGKLVGVAQFDEPSAPPVQCEAILLWKTLDPLLHKVDVARIQPEDILTAEEVESTERWTDENIPKGVLNSIKYYSLKGQLSRTRQIGATQDGGVLPLKGYWSRKPFNYSFDQYMSLNGPGKRTYFLLLVQKVEGQGPTVYQRVGVAICYWVPGLPRFGGFDIRDVVKKKTMRIY